MSFKSSKLPGGARIFYQNIGYQWNIIEPGIQGVIFNASGFGYDRALERGKPPNLPSNVYFDPQLYLLPLPKESCHKSCANLATYPWLPIDIPRPEEFNTPDDWKNNLNQTIIDNWPPLINNQDIKKIVMQTIDFQLEFKASEIIIPSILTNSVESDLSREMTFVDSGLDYVAPKGIPALATFAISDACLINNNPSDNPLLQIAIDQFTARDELVGVYIVVENSRGESLRISNPKVAWSLLEFCHYLNKAGKEVIVNYCDSFGIVCMAAGAKGFAGGFGNKSKRLYFGDYQVRGGGGAYPKFYAHSVISEYLPERDLEKIRDNKLMRLLEADKTPASESLFEVLNSGGSVANLPEWREALGNLSGSRKHYIQKMLEVSNRVNGLTSQQIENYVLSWLQDAERNVVYLNDRFNEDALSDDGRHVKAWRSAFESYLATLI